MHRANKYQASSRYRVTGRLALLLFLSILLCASAFADTRKALRQAEKALRAGDFQKAEQLFRELLKKDDRDTEARLGLSQVLLKQRRLDDSFDHAARVLAIDPLSSRAHALLGSAILAAGDFRLAVEEFRTALTLDEQCAMALAGLAMIDFYENRTLDALGKLRRVVRMAPDEPDYLFSLGQAAARSEKYQEAADAYEAFLVIAPRTDADRRARIRGLIDFLRYLGQQASLYDISGSSRAVLPFEAVDNRPIIKIRINGEKEPFKFVLDTGSGMSVISEETARRLGLRPVARGGMARAIGGGGRFEIVYGYLDSMALGDIRVEHVPVYIRHFFDAHNQIDGYLGIAALGRLLTAVDYGTRVMTLARRTNGDFAAAVDPTRAEFPGSQTARPGIDVPMRITSSGFLSGEVMIEGIKNPLNFIIDTGASVSVLSERSALLEGAQDFIQEDRMVVFGAAGVADNVRIALLPRIAIGAFAREKVNAAVLDLEPINETAGFQQNGILGGNFLRHFRVIFDFQRGVVRLEPLETTRTAGEPLPQEATSLNQ